MGRSMNGKFISFMLLLLFTSPFSRGYELVTTSATLVTVADLTLGRSSLVMAVNWVYSLLADPKKVGLGQVAKSTKSGVQSQATFTLKIRCCLFHLWPNLSSDPWANQLNKRLHGLRPSCELTHHFTMYHQIMHVVIPHLCILCCDRSWK